MRLAYVMKQKPARRRKNVQIQYRREASIQTVQLIRMECGAARSAFLRVGCLAGQSIAVVLRF